MSLNFVTQPHHIFHKDARHLWPESLVYIALLIAYAWSDAQSLLPSDGTFNPAILAMVILRLLLPVSWLILISRLVHDEELVGDRQFWTTRPYTWYSLLAAKVLYIFVLIGLPFLLMQAWVLHHAGLYPTQLLPALFKNLLYIALIYFVPLLAIAAVTATFPRYISSVVGGFIYTFIIFSIAAYKFPESFTAPYLPWIVGIAALLLIAAVVLIQYAKRKTFIARVLLAAIPLVVVFIVIVAPSSALSSHRYPDTSVGTLAFDATAAGQQPTGKLFTFRHKVILDIPAHLQPAGLDSKTFLEAQSARATIDGPNGFHYVSNWSAVQEAFSSQQTEYSIQIPLPEDIYNKVHNQPVALHIELGTQTFTTGTPYTVTALDTAFPIPGHAACTASLDSGQLDCRVPFGSSVYTEVQATVHPGTCLAPGPQSAPAAGGIAPATVPFSFSPVDLTKVPLRVGNSPVAVCPGTPITFTPTLAGTYGRMHLDIPAITLDAYGRRIPTRPTQPTPDPTQPPTEQQ